MTDRTELVGDQLIATRHLDAEPALVWAAFTTPEHLAAFWGGHHATVPPGSVTVDLRVGGSFELETRGADGSSRSLHFRYDVVGPPTLLVLTEPRSGITTEIRLWPSGVGGLVALSLAETRRLLAHLITRRRPRDHINRWSRWRRRHQHRAKISHYQLRLAICEVRLEY